MVNETIVQTMNNNSQYSIAICEIHNKQLHGFDENSSSDIQSHILATYVLDAEEFYDEINNGSMLNIMRRSYEDRMPSLRHDNIRNYNNIVNDPSYFTFDVVKLYELDGYETVVAKKTHWIKIIQKKWRKIYNERQRIIQGRRSVRAIQVRERTGQWPKGLRYLPTIYKQQ